MSKPGPSNSLTDIEGLSVGQAEDAAVGTGVSVIVCARPMVCAVDVRGGGPGTRETELLAPENLVEAVDAVVLSGGSVYGLGAADAVVAALGAQGRGYVIAPGAPTAPIVPGAILFDLLNGGNKAWGDTPPYARLGREALAAAGREVRLGNAGAGYGALAGALKGGLGSASLTLPDGGVVGALAAVNSYGSVVMPGGNAFWAWPFEIEEEFGGARPGAQAVDPLDWGLAKAQPLQLARIPGGEPGSTALESARTNTTLGLVACDYALTPAEAKRVAIMAQDGFARSIRPVHAPFDGDVVFALSAGARPLPAPKPQALAMLGAVAADTLARAVARGVWAAQPLFGRPAWRELRGDGRVG